MLFGILLMLPSLFIMVLSESKNDSIAHYLLIPLSAIGVIFASIVIIGIIASIYNFFYEDRIYINKKYILITSMSISLAASFTIFYYYLM
jgi:hypothetical protein